MTNNNVINFPRIGFVLPPANVPPMPTTPPPTAPAPSPQTTVPATGQTGRRSPLTTLAALPNPATLQPPITAPAPGAVPATFHSAAPGTGPGTGVGPRLGALSLAAILAVAVAALRGAHTVTSTWWEQRQATRAQTPQLQQAKKQAAQHTNTAAPKQRTKIPSSQDYGRKTLDRLGGGRRGPGGASGRSDKTKPTHPGTGSAGPGGKGHRNTPSSSGLGGTTKDRAAKNNGTRKQSFRPGHGLPDSRKPSSGHHNSNRSTRDGGNGNAHPQRKNSKTSGSSPAGTGSTGGTKPNQSGNGGGKGRTTLPQALSKTATKTAKRRLKQRRKNPSTPALWKAAKKTSAAPASAGPASPTTPKNKQKTPTAPKTKTPKQTGPKNGSKTGQPTGAQSTVTGPSSKTTPKRSKKRRVRRITLARALRHTAHQTAKRRLKQRRRTGMRPPIWTTTRTPKTPRGTRRRQAASTARAYAHRLWTKAKTTAKARTRRTATPNGTGSGTASSPNTAGRPGTGRAGRRSPFQNAAQTHSTTWTLTRITPPGTRMPRQPAAPLTTGVHALPAAPTPHTPRPGTTRPRKPIPMPPAHTTPQAVIAHARTQDAHTATTTVGRTMDAQHATEITLDDACDAADQLADDAFKTHDEARRLADKARKLRDTWLQFADDLATNHNLIGPLFTAAAIRFAEAMDLVARMADEMETSSLNAAEKAETAGNELNDAYRPYTTATADAGLTTPSAPIHNNA